MRVVSGNPKKEASEKPRNSELRILFLGSSMLAKLPAVSLPLAIERAAG
jgi:hypothetical protein